jgi:hypothetical protein
MRQKPSPTPYRPDISVWVRHCPKCDPLRVMNIKTIRPAMFGDYDLVIYKAWAMPGRGCRPHLINWRPLSFRASARCRMLARLRHADRC